MRSFRIIFIFAAFIFLLAGCATQPAGNINSNTTTNTTTANTTTNATTTGATRANLNYLPVTLPVLDALFYEDEAFKAALKERLKLTDEQIAQLQKIAREETSKLNETGGDEYSGTTTAARESAAAKIKEVIGEEKAQALAELIRERWGGRAAEGDSGGATAEANSVPKDTRIVVNAPAYRMDVFENGQLVKTYKVGIGYPEFPLPTGRRDAKQIIFNPTWTPPYSPWVKETSEVKKGQPVKAGSPANPLGIAKIPIGLPSLIHGGKSLAQIGGFASHGCVGLTNTQMKEFIQILARIGGATLSEEQVNEYIKNKTETKTVQLGNGVVVDLRYETIVVEDGRLHIYRDVYDHDTNTEERLQQVLKAYGVSLDQFSPEERQQTLDALKEMSRDARGRTDAEQPTSNANANASAQKGAKKDTAKVPEVTRTVKGKKEIVIEVAALKGKGYPAPVALNTGGASGKDAADTKKRR
ncbi:MAG: L,D-transpeptidase family protein [Pyrinomonadaceae bacterium]|nr:L,D-transpeptidase family protein [Pyrinomonadaceae bacterium]